MFWRVFLLYCLMVSAVQADDFSSDWVAHIGGRARLIVAEYDNRAYAAIEVELDPGWHTYWKYPGASGIAPLFEWQASQHVKMGETYYPAPYFFDDGIGGFNGYSTHVILPTVFTQSGMDSRLALNAELGICRELCVPSAFDFTLAVPAQLDESPFVSQIRGALAATPQHPQAALRAAQLSYDGLALQFTIIGHALDDVRIIPIPSSNMIIGDQRIVARAARSWLIEFPAHTVVEESLIAQNIDFIIRNGDFVVEQNLKIRHHR